MAVKPVHLFLISQLLLSLVTFKVNAEESTLLFDKTQGIDNTDDSAAKHINDLNDSLKNIFPNDEILPDVEVKTEAIQAPLKTDTEETFLLIDNSKGIDNIDELLVAPEDKLSEPEKNILPDANTAQDASKVTPSVDTNIVPVNSTPATATPIVTPPVTTEAINSVGKKSESPVPTEKNKTETISKQASTKDEGNTGIWIPQDSDLRILEIRVEAYVLDDVVGAYQYDNVVMLPLSALSSILDIAIDVKTDFAEGFVIKEENTFALDTLRNQVILKGITKSYNSNLVKILDNDIYVESNLLGSWLDMELNIDLYSSRMTIKSETKLPFLARIDRENRMLQSLSAINKTEQEYPRLHEAYENFTPPFIDQTLRLAQRVSDAGNITTFNSITYATADLLQHESTWYLTMDDQNGVNDFRVTFGRTDPDGGLLGPINAKEYKFGHITEPRVGLINSSGNLNYGVSASSYPIGQQTEYDRHRFIGELLPGWEVELYQNNALIGYQQTPINGQYDFQDVPLLFGNNYFRLAFYGPKGEFREETRNFQLSHALTQQGKHYYKASTITDDVGEQRTVAQLGYGVTENISGSLNLVSIPLNELNAIVQHNYLGAGLIGYWDSLLASATFISDSESGNAIEIDLQTRIDDTVIGFKDIHLSKFFSEEFLPVTAEISRRSNLDINTAIPSSFLPRIPISFGFKRDEYTAGGELFETTNQLSVSAYGVAITNQLTHQKVTNQQATGNGNLQISANIANIRLRGTLGYTFKPVNELSNIALTLDPGQYENYRLSFGINHTVQQNLTEISAIANKLSGKYGLSFGVRYDSNSELNLDLNFSIGFGYEPRRNDWHSNPSNLANQGSVSARFFIDSDKDGIFSEGDTPIEDIGLRVNSGYKKERSDKDGILFLTGLSAHDPANVVIASGTLSDPLWTPALDGVRIVPRPGHAIEIDFPIFTTGEIDGTVELVRGDNYIGVGDVTVELVDQNNHVISTTETAYDGFYILSHIPMGEYHVRISKAQLDKLGLISPSEQSININANEPFINGIDFTLRSTKPN